MRFLLILFTGVILCPGLINLTYSQSKGGHWQFENNGYDTADWDGFDDNGSLQGNASYSSVSPSQQGMTYLFMDTVFTHDFFKVENSNDLNFTDENIGISAWIYPIVLNDVHFLVNKGRQDSNPKTTNYALRISNSKNLEFLVRDASNQAHTVASSFIIPVNQWTFVAAYYDYSLGKVFMWNTPSASATDTLDFIQPLIPNSDPLSIGSWYRADPNSPSIKDFEGRMDDVRISGRLEDVVPAGTGISVNPEQVSREEQISLDVFPNPVQLSNSGSNVTIQFKIAQPEQVTVSIYNILGQKIFYAAPGIAAPENRIIWDLKGFNGNLVSSGMYFIHIKARNISSIRKFLILE